MPSASQSRLGRDEFVKFAEDTQSRRASKTDHASDAAHPRPRGDLDLYLKRKVYQEEFASDLPRRTSAVLYATQRPAAAGGVRRDGHRGGLEDHPVLDGGAGLAPPDHLVEHSGQGGGLLVRAG